MESGGRDIKQCAPGPPMDIMEEMPGCSRDVAETDDDEGFLDHRYENTGLIPQIDKPMSIPYLCCKLWRWKELQVKLYTLTLIFINSQSSTLTAK